MTSTEIETAIDALLPRHSITYSAQLVGERTTDDRTHDLWDCTLKKGGQAYHFEYKTGIGLRRLGKQHWRPTQPVKPTAAGVLHCLCYDVECGNYTFEEFCSNVGYDTDSRMALNVYLACQEIGSKLRQLLGRALLQEISDIVAEY